MNELLDEIKNFYAEAFQTFNRNAPVPEINVEFYPYIGINHTIRLREKRLFVRLAEMCRDLPQAAQRALAFILVAKLYRKKIPQQISEIYRAAINNQELRERAVASRRERGRKIITTPIGEVYNLGEIFAHLNQIYFDGKIPEPVLSWSAQETFRILGHHDSAHETIVVSRSLDSKRVPKHVVEFVVFHEMLHIAHPTIHRNGRRYNHTPAFRRDERQFAYYEEAENWIENNVKNLKRKVKNGKRKM